MLQRPVTICSVFGLKLNQSKTEAIWIGNNIGNQKKPLNLNWNDRCFKCLRIWCNTNAKLMIYKKLSREATKIENSTKYLVPMLCSLKG